VHRAEPPRLKEFTRVEIFIHIKLVKNALFEYSRGTSKKLKINFEISSFLLKGGMV